MGITSALVTALSGLSTSQSQIDVVGNNIANVNTVGFKSSQLDFKTQFLENFSYGSAPDGNLGGTNPLQIGLGRRHHQKFHRRLAPRHRRPDQPGHPGQRHVHPQ